MNVKELDDLYETGFYSIVCANLSSDEANSDVAEASKNLAYLHEMEKIKASSIVPKKEQKLISDAIAACEKCLEKLKGN